MLQPARALVNTLERQRFSWLARPTVLYVHGVVRSFTDERVQSLHLKADDFRGSLSALKSLVRFVSAEEAIATMREGATNKPVAVLTCDDGFANNHDLLLDLVNDLKIPLTIFVSTHHVETGERFPTYVGRCFAYYGEPGIYQLPHLQPVHLTNHERSRSLAAKQIREAFKKLPQKGVRELCAALHDVLGRDRQAELDEKFESDRPLTWSQIRAMHSAGVEIGAHCHEHAILHCGQPIAEVSRQVTQSKALIEAEIGRCSFFAFPAGKQRHITAEALNIVQNAGFSAAFSTLEGTLAGSTDMFLLPRIMLHRNGRLDKFLLPFRSLLHDGTLRGRQSAIARSNVRADHESISNLPETVPLPEPSATVASGSS